MQKKAAPHMFFQLRNRVQNIGQIIPKDVRTQNIADICIRICFVKSNEQHFSRIFILVSIDCSNTREPLNNFLDSWPLERILVDAQAGHIQHLQHLFIRTFSFQEWIEDFILLALAPQSLHPGHQLS
ncbi:hypothetical protein ES332_A10G001100v1 [Gossypium tomentosum]|uniref:Uncharacterized protein n=1 Tax=Gossypium tomentosum TaxID=34277 RepID=A0A5D2NJ87_GOSTO|nr:hypothetical protein ES332_A10G001100v1 [Gossypium tomentosum]